MSGELPRVGQKRGRGGDPRARAAVGSLPPITGRQLNYLARPSARRQLLRLQPRPAPEGSPCHLGEWNNSAGRQGQPQPGWESWHPAAPGQPQAQPTRNRLLPVGRRAPPPQRRKGSAGVCQPKPLAASSAPGKGRASDSLHQLFLIPHGSGQALLPGKQLSQSLQPPYPFISCPTCR